jgi:hypothetical protein
MKIILSIMLLTLFVSCSKEKVDVETKTPEKSLNTDNANEAVAEVTKDVEAKVAEVTKDVEAKVAEVTTKVAEAKEQLETVTKVIDTLKSGNFEVACGMCVFKDPGCKTCKVYVKYADKVYPLAGLELDPKTLGLCKTSANADVKGEVKDNSFSATSLDNLKLNLPKIPSTPKGALDQLKKISF